jgi:hypothetical protein
MEWRIRTSTFAGLIMALLLPALALLSVASAATSDGSQASDPTRQLGIWEGRWTYTEHDYETPYSQAHTSDGTADCDWTPNRGFMMCDFLNRNPGAGTPVNDVAIFCYSPAARTYMRLQVFRDAKPFLAQITVKGNTWVTSVDFPDKRGTIIYRDVYVFSSDDKQRITTAQISADKGRTWVTVSRFTAVKVST